MFVLNWVSLGPEKKTKQNRFKLERDSFLSGITACVTEPGPSFPALHTAILSVCSLCVDYYVYIMKTNKFHCATHTFHLFFPKLVAWTLSGKSGCMTH